MTVSCRPPTRGAPSTRTTCRQTLPLRCCRHWIATMIEPANGLVIRYDYLWAREYDRQGESGREDRPACVQIIIAGTARTIVPLSPITSRKPNADRTALEIPEIEARRAGLDLPAWIVVDEW